MQKRGGRTGKTFGSECTYGWGQFECVEGELQPSITEEINTLILALYFQHENRIHIYTLAFLFRRLFLFLCLQKKKPNQKQFEAAHEKNTATH